ncbi:MAG TPA: ABC transporter ATP-binding protein [Anaerolineales bacterium]|nr:ABC transporter ATP-binding protein [Anaerolineales bacterium]
MAAGAPPQLYRNFLNIYLRPNAPKAAGLLVLFGAVIGLELWLPAILGRFVDQALVGEAVPALVRTGGLFLGISFLSQITTVWQTYLATDIGLTATNRLRADLTRHCLSLDLPFHNAHTPGELIERVDGDSGVLNRFFSSFVVQLAGNAVLLVGVLVLLFTIDVRVGAALTGFAVVTIILLGRFASIGIPLWNAAKEVRAGYFGFIEERLSGTEDIRANGAVAYVLHGLARRARAYFRKSLVADVIGSSAFGLTIVLFSIGGAIALGLAAWIYLEGTITIGTAYLIVAYTQLLTRPIEGIIRELDDLQEAGASLRRVGELLALQPGLVDGKDELPPGPLEVRLDRVSFAYADATEAPDEEEPVENRRVLSDVSLDLPPGAVLGLLGRTGSGKTTITRLLTRFYDPDEGAVLLAKRLLPGLRFASLRTRIGVVTQDVQLFNASVRDNLSFFDRTISDERIREALEALELRDWVESFPEGLDTRLQSGGEGLSAGEAQLLAFARIFLKDPGLIILDEASSRLDPVTEARLERSITRLLAGRTAVIIAHRLETIRRADRIAILQDGAVLEQGDRLALLADPGSVFSRLLQTGLEQELA